MQAVVGRAFDYEGTGKAQLEIQAWILDVGEPPVAAGRRRSAGSAPSEDG